jgi:hypothetical protein
MPCINDPLEINSNEILCDDILNLENILNKFGIVVVALNSITSEKLKTTLNKTKFYSTANDMLKIPVEEPTLEEKINPMLFKKRDVPDALSGFIHQYFTPAHHLIHMDETFRCVMNELYGQDLKYLPNRMRITSKYKYDENSIHIEGVDLFENDNGTIKLKNGEIATLVGLTGNRRFVFWDVKNKDLKPLYDYWKKRGEKEFTNLDPKWMEQNYPNCRKVINIDCTKCPVIIIWRETTPHEIALSPSLSLYMSPTTKFNESMVVKVNTMQNKEYEGISMHASNLIGICYEQPGFLWPSGKKTYSFCHNRAYNKWTPLVKDYFKNNGKLQSRLITCGNIDHKSENYRKMLLEKKIILPDRIFEDYMPNITLDILNIPDVLLKEYGFKL